MDNGRGTEHKKHKNWTQAVDVAKPVFVFLAFCSCASCVPPRSCVLRRADEVPGRLSLVVHVAAESVINSGLIQRALVCPVETVCRNHAVAKRVIENPSGRVGSDSAHPGSWPASGEHKESEVRDPGVRMN